MYTDICIFFIRTNISFSLAIHGKELCLFPLGKAYYIWAFVMNILRIPHSFADENDPIVKLLRK